MSLQTFNQVQFTSQVPVADSSGNLGAITVDTLNGMDPYSLATQAYVASVVSNYASIADLTSSDGFSNAVLNAPTLLGVNVSGDVSMNGDVYMSGDVSMDGDAVSITASSGLVSMSGSNIDMSGNVYMCGSRIGMDGNAVSITANSGGIGLSMSGSNIDMSGDVSITASSGGIFSMSGSSIGMDGDAVSITASSGIGLSMSGRSIGMSGDAVSITASSGGINLDCPDGIDFNGAAYVYGDLTVGSSGSLNMAEGTIRISNTTIIDASRSGILYIDQDGYLRIQMP